LSSKRLFSLPAAGKLASFEPPENTGKFRKEARKRELGK
jgi:hypothetical protein